MVQPSKTLKESESRHRRAARKCMLGQRSQVGRNSSIEHPPIGGIQVRSRAVPIVSFHLWVEGSLCLASLPELFHTTHLGISAAAQAFAVIRQKL